MKKHVVIVGGGVSGLSAANVLCQSGQFDVTIVEAEGRLGGRIHSIDFHGENIELGAQWIHGCEGNEVYELLSKELGISSFRYEGDRYCTGGKYHAIFASGREVTPAIRHLLHKAPELVTIMITRLKNDLESGNVSENDLKHVTSKSIAKLIWEEEFVKTSDVDKAVSDAIFKSVLLMMNTADGLAANKGSCLIYNYYREILSEDVIVKDSLSVLLDVLTEKIPCSSIKLSSKVRTIFWNSDFFRTSIGQSFSHERIKEMRKKVSSQSEDQTARSQLNIGESNMTQKDQDVNLQTCSPSDVLVSHGLNGLVEKFSNYGNGGKNLKEQERCVGKNENCHSKGTGQSQVQVDYVDKNGNEVTLSADHVIVTVSLGVLKKYHKSLFVPNLPAQKQKSLRKMGFGTMNKILFYYKERFWKEDDFPVYLFWDCKIKPTIPFREKQSWCQQLKSVESWKENFLILWMNEKASNAVKDLSKIQVWEDVRDLLCRFNANIMLPMPDDIIITQWGLNENFLGSYSSTGIGETMQTKKIASEPLSVDGIPKVLFAGEAMHESRFSTVDGAYVTGIREAQRLLALYEQF